MKNKITFFFPIFITLLLIGCGPGELGVEDSWARPGNAGANSAVYFQVNNPGDQADVLLSAESDVAEYLELHMSMMSDDGTMSMQEQESVPIPQNSSVMFEPGGLHLMLINLQTELNPGDEFPLVLRFQEAGPVEIVVLVREP